MRDDNIRRIGDCVVDVGKLLLGAVKRPIVKVQLPRSAPDMEVIHLNRSTCQEVRLKVGGD